MGEVPIVGSPNYYKLSTGLLNVLHEKGVFYLSQISRDLFTNHLSSPWMFTIDLEILEQFKQEWEGYVVGLKGSGIQVMEVVDVLCWPGTIKLVTLKCKPRI